MKATWDRLEKNWMQFTVEVEADRFARAVEDAYRRLVRKARIPGFRPGKAPRFIFERYYGKESLLQEAVESLLPEAYAQAVADAGIEPIDQPEIDLEVAREGEPFTFKGRVQTKPEVKLGRLSGFDVPYNMVPVTAEQVDEQLERLRERMAQLAPDPGGEVRQGSFAVIDAQGYLDGEPFEGSQLTDYVLEIGSGRFIPGFEEQLVGARAGEEREVKVTFPDDYPEESLRSRSATFRVTVKDVKKKELPELTDAFAREVSPFQTLQELRSDIENRLRETARAQAERDFSNRVAEAVVADAEVEVPEVLIHRRVHNLIDDFAQSLSRQGLTLDEYMQATGKDSEALHKEFEEPAARQVKLELVLEAVAAREGLQVTEAEIDAEFDAMAGLYRNQASDLARLRRNPEYRQPVRESLLKQKAGSHLVALNRPAGSSPSNQGQAGEEPAGRAQAGQAGEGAGTGPEPQDQ